MNRSLGILIIAIAGCKSSASTPAPAGPPADAGPGTTPASYDFSAMEAELFAGPWKTDGAVVMVGGQVVYEKYANGYDADKRHITYSVSKTVGATLVGIAIDEKLLALTDSVCTYVTPPAGADPTLCDTTIDDLVRMSSGLKWNEDYSDPTTSSILPMLYGDTDDMGAFTAMQPRAAPHGTVWLYSSGDANLLALALKGALAKAGQTDMRAFAQEKLFGPAEMASAIFESDRSGTLVFSSSAFMTPRDMGKLGQLYLDGGMHGGAQVVSADWVNYAKTPAPPVASPTPRAADAGPGDSGGSYGASLWLNAAAPTATADTLLYPQIPVDAYSAEGHWGQKIFVVPSRKMVVVRVGDDRDVEFDPDVTVAKAVAAVDAAGGAQ